MKDFDVFCAMIDCSRNGVMSVAAFKKAVPVFAAMGYNALMLYTEDTYEIPGEPFFGYKRGRYSLAELKEMDDFAFENGIELIPCIQTLAHMQNIFRWPCYGEIRDMAGTMLADSEKTYAFIEKMIRTARACFRSRRIHIGMDEAYHLGRGNYLDLHGSADRYEVLLRHLGRVCEIAEKYDFRPLLWNDMFFKMETGEFLNVDVSEAPAPVYFSERVRKSVPAGVGLCHWDYLGISEKHYENMLSSTKQLAEEVWFAGGVYDTMNFAPENRLSMLCHSKSIPVCRKLGVRNVIITIWGDVGKDCATMAALPGFMYAAGIARGLSDEEIREEFLRITGEDFDEMLLLDAPNDIYGTCAPERRANYAMTRFYNDPFLGLMDLNASPEVNGGRGDGKKADRAIFGEYAEKLHRLAEKSSRFGYLYEKEACLCAVLEKKFDLGTRTRALYAAGDKAGLSDLAESDYAALPGLISAFHEAFRREWYEENKGFGWEIQDMRLGGVRQRVETCRQSLLDYCDGKISGIEELEEPVLPADGDFVWFWRNMISACPHGGE